jgi:hypothetical protein
MKEQLSVSLRYKEFNSKVKLTVVLNKVGYHTIQEYGGVEVWARSTHSYPRQLKEEGRVMIMSIG